jgi:hypothetical protein
MSNRSPMRRFARRLVLLAVLVTLAYPVSLGPVCWAMSWFRLEQCPEVTDGVYWTYLPLAPATVDGSPEPVRRALRWWIKVGMPARTEFHDWPKGVGWSNPGYSYTLWHY